MSDPPEISGIKNVFNLPELSPEVQRQVYEDLFQGSLQKFGGAFEAVSEYLTSPLRFIAVHNLENKLRLERALLSVQAKFDALPGTTKQKPASEIAQPILDELLIVQDETIAEMFAQLLASACIEGEEGKVHRGFVSILKELVPDEAMILNSDDDLKSVAMVRRVSSDSVAGGRRPIFVGRGKVDVKRFDYVDTDSILLYLDNLVRLGILALFQDSSASVDRAEYLRVTRLINEECRNYYRGEPSYQHPHLGLTYTGLATSYYSITEIGKEFRAACRGEKFSRTDIQPDGTLSHDIDPAQNH